MKARAKSRWSLRFNVALLVLAVLLAPLGLVAAWLGMERRFETAMKNNAVFTLNEAVAALDARPVLIPAPTSNPGSLAVSGSDSSGEAPQTESALEGVARRHRVRIRVVTFDGLSDEDYDYDSGHDFSERAGGVVLRPNYYQHPEPSTDLRGDIVARPEVVEARANGEAQGCEDVVETGGIVCFAARKLRGDGVLHVQDSADRPLPLLYALRFQLGRLTLLVLPLAMLLAFLVGRRLAGPLAALRDQVLAKVREPRPRADLQAPATSETDELAQAFNTLLQRLEERRHENESFVADLVHEFKNPVATIRACGESLTAKELTPERAERLARLLLESSTRLDALVSQFLELARAEAGMQNVAWEQVDLAALAKARIEHARVDERWAPLTLEFDAATPAPVRGVPERLETLLDNLLANAASFAREHGTVRAAVIVHAAEVELSVSDDGAGIAEQDLPHVFERFFTTRRHDKGTGLGLALVRAIAEAHGGRVAVTSQLGEGATFRAFFPLVG